MGSVAVGAMVVGTSLLVVFALAMATLETQVEESLAQIEASAEPLTQFTIENAQSDVTFTVDREQVNAKATKGKWNGNELKLTPAEAKSFTVEVMQKYN